MVQHYTYIYISYSYLYWPFLAGSGSGVFNAKRFREVLRDFVDLVDGVVLGGRDVADFSGLDDTEVGVLAGELGVPGPLRS